jgi:LysR family transcriptional regulator, glycine cleavage system transcriptional activator
VVSSTPGFTAKWLVPRLYRFLARHPEIETRITASAAYANFTSDGVDVGIRLSSGVHPDLYVEKFSDEWLLPLCSPRIFNGEHPLQSPQDLVHFPLIQVDLPGLVPTWADWLRMAGIDGIDSTRGLRLNVADHALDAASEGMGIVLAYKMVASRDIILGRLVPPFGPEIPVPGRAYYFVCARGQQKRAPVKAFRDWVFAEMEETHASLKAALSQAADKGSDPTNLTPYARAIYREAPKLLTPAAAAPAAAAGRRAPSPSRRGPRQPSR